MELLTIGRFARLAGLTVRAVRHYCELGLLQPAFVDPETGYRYFTVDQVADAAAIRRLRLLELALDDIREILAADDPSFTHSRLVRHRAKMVERAAAIEQIVATLQNIIEREEELMPATADFRHEGEIKDVPGQPVRVRLVELSELIPTALAAIAGYLEIGEWVDERRARFSA